MTAAVTTVSGPATGDNLRTIKPDVLASQINEAWRAYNGQLSDPIPVSIGKPNDNIKTNHCKIAVDVIVSSLFGKPFTVTLDEESDDSTPEEQWLENVFKVNNFQVLFQKLAMNGSISGHAFLKIKLGGAFPKLVVLDPANVRATTTQDDVTDVVCYTVTWKGTYKGQDAEYRQRIEHSDIKSVAGDTELTEAHIDSMTVRSLQTIPGTPEVPHWRIIDQVRTKDTAFYKDGQSDVAWETLAIDIWPYPFAPIVDCQNKVVPNAFWGEPDLSPDVIAIQKGINRALTNINKILRFHAHPKTYATGTTQQQLQEVLINPEGILGFPNPEAALHNLEMQSDLTSSIEYYKRLREAFHELVKVPEATLGKMDTVGAVSGIALKIVFGSLVTATESKRLLYGNLITQLAYRLLFINFGKDITILTNDELFLTNMLWEPTIIWEEILPVDDEAEARTLLLDTQLGASKETALTKRGYDPEKEAELRKAENAEAMKQAQQAMDLQSRGQVPGTDPFGRDRNASNGGNDSE